MIHEGPLGMMPPTTDEHRVKYPLTTSTVPSKPSPLVIGVPWFASFDRPEPKQNGRWTEYIIGADPANLGRMRGGHCTCVPYEGARDSQAWWHFYDQGAEGACVGFGVARALTLMNRERYDAFEIYRTAQRQDEWEGEAYSGTSVRAGLDVVRERGPIQCFRGKRTGPNPLDGFLSNRWARDIADVWVTLQSPRLEARGLIPIKNSWGPRYPFTVLMPEETFIKVAINDGESAIITDRTS